MVHVGAEGIYVTVMSLPERCAPDSSPVIAVGELMA